MSAVRFDFSPLVDEPGVRCELSLEGEIDLYTVPRFKQMLAEWIDYPELVLDFAKVTFMDSSGYGAILGATKRRRGKGIMEPIEMRTLPRPIKETLQLTRFIQLVRVTGEVFDPPRTAPQQQVKVTPLPCYVNPFPAELPNVKRVVMESPLPPLMLSLSSSVTIAEAVEMFAQVPSSPEKEYGAIIFNFMGVEESEEGVFSVIRDNLCWIQLYGPPVEVIGGPWRFPRYTKLDDEQIRSRIQALHEELESANASRSWGAPAKKARPVSEAVREASRRGGEVTASRYGVEHYQRIGRKGGEVTARRHGPRFYEEIGRKGGQRVRELVQLARELEEKKK